MHIAEPPHPLAYIPLSGRNLLQKLSIQPKRENHLVPQFYLRYFSSAPKRTNLFNFSRQRMIPGASIKHQCSRRNFYEFAPKLEDTFAELEANAAGVIRRIDANDHLPDANSDDWLSLLAFIVFQKLRTSNAARSDDAVTEYLGRLVMEGHPKLADIDPNSVKLRSVYSVAMPLSVAGEILPLAADLEAHLLSIRQNASSLPAMIQSYCTITIAKG